MSSTKGNRIRASDVSGMAKRHQSRFLTDQMKSPFSLVPSTSSCRQTHARDPGQKYKKKMKKPRTSPNNDIFLFLQLPRTVDERYLKSIPSDQKEVTTVLILKKKQKNTHTKHDPDLHVHYTISCRSCVCVRCETFEGKRKTSPSTTITFITRTWGFAFRPFFFFLPPPSFLVHVLL